MKVPQTNYFLPAVNYLSTISHSRSQFFFQAGTLQLLWTTIPNFMNQYLEHQAGKVGIWVHGLRSNLHLVVILLNIQLLKYSSPTISSCIEMLLDYFLKYLYLTQIRDHMFWVISTQSFIYCISSLRDTEHYWSCHKCYSICFHSVALPISNVRFVWLCHPIPWREVRWV